MNSLPPLLGDLISYKRLMLQVIQYKRKHLYLLDKTVTGCYPIWKFMPCDLWLWLLWRTFSAHYLYLWNSIKLFQYKYGLSNFVVDNLIVTIVQKDSNSECHHGKYLQMQLSLLNPDFHITKISWKMPKVIINFTAKNL